MLFGLIKDDLRLELSSLSSTSKCSLMLWSSITVIFSVTPVRLVIFIINLSSKFQRFVARPSRLGRRTEGEGVPTTLSSTSTPTSSSAASRQAASSSLTTSHRHGSGIACSTTSSQQRQVPVTKLAPPVAKQRLEL